MTKETVFTAQQVSRLTVQEIERRRNNPHDGLKTQIPLLDEDLNPMRNGQLIVVLGRPSNYKSGIMQIIARNTTDQIRKNENEIIIYVTWEQSIEEHGLIELAAASRIDASKMARGELNDTEWKSLMKAAVRRGVTPLWLIGHSSQAGKRRPRLSMTDLGEALAYIVDEAGKTPRLICLDYLQRIRPDNGSGTQREKMMGIVDRAKDMALAFNVPVVLGTQAGRQVDERKWKLPQMADGQETSNLEQSADVMMSVWMPKTSEMPGTYVGNPEMEVTEDLLYLGLLKQKFGVAPRTYALRVKPAINKIERR